MVQLQMVIDFSDNKIKVNVNQLKREDATEEELFVAKQLEGFFLETWKMVGSEAGLQMTEKHIKPTNDEQYAK